MVSWGISVYVRVGVHVHDRERERERICLAQPVSATVYASMSFGSTEEERMLPSLGATPWRTEG